jgi:hypothetical protein
MSKITQPPWHVEDGRVLSAIPAADSLFCVPVADLSLAFKSSAEMAANGALIANAPELAVVVEDLLALTSQWFGYVNLHALPEGPVADFLRRTAAARAALDAARAET